ncbi:MAG TPA: indole-3-glycerol phosphate synthase TrpC [Candidatus Baltobacteraceae bacterium]|nr:indole-3-glycerol phosphate synthase TrpC [Candidatus Baltobacteraceae bacterium]
MVDILHRIYDAKAAVSAQEETREPYDVVRAHALARRRERRPFLQAIRNADGPAIVGEIKRASPSAGLIARNFDPASIARMYDASGVDCISVLTEADHFLGELEYLDVARKHSLRPLLRKDFLSTPYHIAQSAAYGADAVLLIVAGLRDEQLRECMDEAAKYDLDVLVEVHDRAELTRALALGAALVGINNRNLRTFETDLAVSEYLLPHVPENVTVVSESGMQGPEDILRLHGAGARGFLVGEALMRADAPGELIQALKSAIHTPAMH